MKGLSKLLPGFSFFYTFLRYRLFLVLIVSVLVSLADSLGLSMFIPLFSLASDESFSTDKDGVAGLQGESIDVFLSFFSALGLEASLSSVLVLMLVLFSVKGLLVFSMYYMSTIYEQYFARKLRFNMIENLNVLKYEAFLQEESGRIQNALSGETQKVILAFKTYLKTFQQILMIATYVTLAFISNSKFALLVVIVGGVVNLSFGRLYRKTKSLSALLVEENNKFQTLLLQLISQFRYLSATGSIHRFSSYLKKRVIGLENTTKRIGILSSLLIGTREPIMVGVVALTIYVQVIVLGGSMESILFSLLLFYRALTSLSIFQNSYNRFLSFSGSLDSILSFIDYLKNNNTIWGNDQVNEINAIRLREVSYTYQGSLKGVNDIDLLFEKNKIYAFVGESGSGKSTLANIIVGLLEVKTGQVLLNGEELNTYNRQEFTSRVGYITQDPVIFIDTFFNNVTLWEKKTEKSLKHFREVLRQTALLSHVESLENGEDTELGLNGVNLSGGQKQRVAIARELYKNVDFLILDEATSALDSGTEGFIQEQIQQLAGETTLFVIAHRLSTIRKADEIFLLNNGSIVARGKFDALYERSEEFRNMVNLQRAK